MDHVHRVFFGHGDDSLNVQIRPHRPFAFPHAVGFIGLEAMHRKPVFLRVNRHGLEPQLRGGPHDTDGDLGAIGHEQFLGFAGGENTRLALGSGHRKRGAFSRGSLGGKASADFSGISLSSTRELFTGPTRRPAADRALLVSSTRQEKNALLQPAPWFTPHAQDA